MLGGRRGRSVAVEEVLVPFPAPIARISACTAVRSTLITSSLKSLRDDKLFDRYFAQLPEELRDRILYIPAGIWVPVADAQAHYAACDRMGLGTTESLRLGGLVAAATQRSVLGLAARLAQEGGVSPWTVIGHTSKYWSRLFDGSAVSVIKLGPKEARIETAGNSLQEYGYFRTAFRGLMTAMTAPFCTKMYVRETPVAGAQNHHTVCRLSWV